MLCPFLNICETWKKECFYMHFTLVVIVMSLGGGGAWPAFFGWSTIKECLLCQRKIHSFKEFLLASLIKQPLKMFDSPSYYSRDEIFFLLEMFSYSLCLDAFFFFFSDFHNFGLCFESRIFFKKSLKKWNLKK